MMLGVTATGDPIHRYHRCLVVPFSGPRKVISTAMEHGGYQENLTAIFNQDVNPGPGRLCEHMEPGQQEKMQSFIREELGLAPDTVARMATIVSMESAAIKSETYDILTVTAITTASLEVNGGRIGEKATSYEKNGEYINLRPGTINSMVFVSGNMTQGCMARAMVTATEAKTAACQELMASSLYSTGIATGSGTDNLMIICDSESTNRLTYAGKHGKLGELIGRLVRDTVKESLNQHMALNPVTQHRLFARMKRYGVTEGTFFKKFNELSHKGQRDFPKWIDRLHRLDQEDELVTMTSLYVHLMDQLGWGLLSGSEAINGGVIILKQIAKDQSINLDLSTKQHESAEAVIQKMVNSFVTTLSEMVMANEIKTNSEGEKKSNEKTV
ncbi:MULTISPECIES: adenosylcobinamide amidohydrolase [unclassified Acetobacterium]|uniref:adenosylcobinamide amidohydrolase n=1 Tax=unclassified Acetobacterium TaxID=2638182 RepID=UPI000DBEB3EF|nr:MULTISPECIES: adenosylcobinamide amidohydrolase [unclassified Acetobacterium]AWW28038.1 adenosylcobinamide amidohydrolase [Acetobacterium sp. KB-1]MDZ5726463.1 adenosylcobinamide amidohydrolase [Acetobacterium sp. K1/6]